MKLYVPTGVRLVHETMIVVELEERPIVADEGDTVYVYLKVTVQVVVLIDQRGKV